MPRVWREIRSKRSETDNKEMLVTELISAIGMVTGTIALLVAGKGDIKIMIAWLLGVGCALVIVEGLI